MAIQFFSEIKSFGLKNKRAVKLWLNKSAASEGYKPHVINYIFCDDAYLFDINVTYLNHKTLTDIITFQYETVAGKVSGDIFISIERVTANAQKFNTYFEDELHRVMVHGLLHLCGYKDKSASEKKQMRAKENTYLALM